MSKFSQGDVVISSVTAQGLTKGALYMVRDVQEFNVAFASFIEYGLESLPRMIERSPHCLPDVDQLIYIRNGHFFLHIPTLKEAIQIARSFDISLRKVDGEFQLKERNVRWSDDSVYYTNDISDAILTAQRLFLTGLHS